ncbi:MAG: class I SAM-dependent methyltransferase, partial [Chloroflexi bacterium]|nr:class I SAM-dependent methyltransferase [Chloroflexota bacterium]
MKMIETVKNLVAKTPQLARGFFEDLKYQDEEFTIRGWMLLPEKRFDSITLYVDQRKVASTATTERKDVAKALPFIPNAEQSGFSFSLHRPAEEMNGILDVRVVGVSKGREIARMETWYRTDLYSCLPTPPPHLISRVAAHQDPSFYLLTGMQTYKEFWTTACKHTAPDSIKSMLDWGCGCGRVTGFFSKFSEIPHVYGCDIDAEAISWCNDNLKPAEFSPVPLHPPTAYADRSFDLIVSFSVLTHLSKENQFSWLKEMQRLLRPGGLFLATVHGEFAAAFSFPGKSAKRLLKKGICEIEDNRLDDIAPKDYYRGTFQKRKYTLKEWSPYFEILEYKERGASNYQDMVVMKRR